MEDDLDTKGTVPGGLRFQLILGLLILFGATFAMITTIVETILDRREKAHRMENTARAVRFLPKEEWNPENLHRIASEQGLEMISVRDHTDHFPTAAWAQGSEIRPERLAWLEGASSGTDFSIRESEYFVLHTELSETTRLTLVSPVSDHDGPELLERRMMWLLFFMSALFILCLAYAFFTFLVMRPLRVIGLATERAFHGDLASPISKMPRNEFGALAKQFNHMLARLKDHRREQENRLEELKNTNEKLQQTQSSLIRSAKLASIGQLAAGIAHEVGNPLAALTGYNELLAEGNLSDEDCADALNRSKIQLQRIQQIIRNLLDFSRIETTEVRPTNLGVHVKNVIELIAGLQRSRSVVIQWNDPGAPMALAEPTQFEQALLNLLLNALDAVEERVEPCISLDITWSDDTIRMSITDNGMGISLMDQEMIFDPFYTTKEPGKGTGLGLSIVHHMIEDMGGNIEVSSDGESGTKFELSFRRAQGLFCAK